MDRQWMCCVHGAHGSELESAVLARTVVVVAGTKLVAAAAPRASQFDVEIAVDFVRSLVVPLVAD
jgi:hypothetical protein